MVTSQNTRETANCAEFTREERIAYFSMEIALENGMPIYSGGLGCLAGDALMSAADLGLPLVGVTLASRLGHFRQEIGSGGQQIEHSDPWDPAAHATALNARVAVRIAGRDVWICGWLYVVTGRRSHRVPVLLLDTDVPSNHADDRAITNELYGGGESYRLAQEVVLGIGGMRLLHALGFRVRRYHMNEGHSALLTLELLNRFRYAEADVRRDESAYDVPRVRAHCNFTTHTPVEADHDKFSYELVGRVLDHGVDVSAVRRFSGDGGLNMT
jgi:starch phosphorylase